jgi:hypothetical protein
MTLLELLNNSRYGISEFSSVLITDTNLKSWINSAERDIAAKTGCIESIQPLTTTSGTRLVAFTGDKVNAIEFLIGGVYMFLPGGEVNWQDTDDVVWQDTNDAVWIETINNLWVAYPPVSSMHITPHNLGHIPLRGVTSPQYWFQWNNYIVIEPVPDDVYNMNAYVSISPTNEMTSNTNEPQIPKEFQEAIVPYTIMMGALKAKRFNDAAIKYNEYISILQLLIDKYIRRKPSRLSDVRLPDMTRLR